MKYGSLFTGIGGFDRGFDQAGMECAWQVEIDPACRNILARHWPNTRRYEDVRERNNLERVDVVCGGFPCQDVSIAGRRAGLAGERSGLWYEFHRVLAELEPQWVVIENVPGLLSANGGRDFATVLQGLVELGYGVAWRILDAQYFGVAQRRRRVFIVGSLGDGRAAEVLFEPESGERNTPPRKQAQERYPKTFGQRVTETIAKTLVAGSRYDSETETFVVGTLAASAGGLNRPAGNANELDFCINTSGIRRLTPLECERLQGFPDGWTGGQGDVARYKQLGNSVAVPVIEWIGKRLCSLPERSLL